MKKFGWKCPLTGKIYEDDDPVLKGLGFPPGSPDSPPGVGLIPMQRIVIEKQDQNKGGK